MPTSLVSVGLVTVAMTHSNTIAAPTLSLRPSDQAEVPRVVARRRSSAAGQIAASRQLGGKGETQNGDDVSGSLSGMFSLQFAFEILAELFQQIPKAVETQLHSEPGDRASSGAAVCVVGV